MGNCLKTQLKEVVNNNNLDRLGCLKVTVHHGEQSQYTLYFGFVDSIGKATIVGNGYFINSEGVNVGKEINSLWGGDYSVSNPAEGETYDIYFDSKYNLDGYNDGGEPLSLNINSLNYSSLLRTLVIRDNRVTGTYTVPENNILITFRNDSNNAIVILDNVKYDRIKAIAGNYKISQAKLAEVCPYLTEFSISKDQGYVIDVSLFGCNILNYNETQQFSWLNTRTGNMISLINLNLGEYIDTMLLNMAELNKGTAESIAVNGTSSYETNPTVQAAINTIKNKGVNVNINGIVL